MSDQPEMVHAVEIGGVLFVSPAMFTALGELYISAIEAEFPSFGAVKVGAVEVRELALLPWVSQPIPTEGVVLPE